MITRGLEQWPLRLLIWGLLLGSNQENRNHPDNVEQREVNSGNWLHMWWESQRRQAEDTEAAQRSATAGSFCHPEAGGTKEGSTADQCLGEGTFSGSWIHSGPFSWKLTLWRRNGHSIEPTKTEKGGGEIPCPFPSTLQAPARVSYWLNRARSQVIQVVGKCNV